MTNGALLEVRHLRCYFGTGRRLRLGGSEQHVVRAVDDVSFDLAPGETLGLVGESGCGKTTLGRAILRLIEPTSGEVYFRGRNVLEMTSGELRDVRREMQIVFQDPYSSLNPRISVGTTIREPLDIYRIGTARERKRRVDELLERVGLNSSFAGRYPHELSGGQRQRVGIAAALALKPSVIIADEPVSALDVSVQAQILNLLDELQRDLGLAMIFVGHNLSVVEHVSDRIAVMYLGKIVETAPVERLFREPEHPYTKALLSAIPVPDPAQPLDLSRAIGDMPSPLHPPSGCHFHPRCPEAIEICPRLYPRLQAYAPACSVACHVAARRHGLPDPAVEDLRDGNSCPLIPDRRYGNANS